MYNYYIFPPSYANVALRELEENFKSLLHFTQISDVLDHIIYDNTFWDSHIEGGIDIGTALYSKFEDKQFSTTILPKLFAQFQYHQRHYHSLAELESCYVGYHNALWGIHFEEKFPNYLSTIDNYKSFRINSIYTTHPAKLFEHKRFIFSNLIVTENAEKQILSYGTGKKYKQIIDHLLIIERFVIEKWRSGVFNLELLKEVVDASDESDTVKLAPNLKQHRYFNLPNIGGVYCFLHIKFGDFRVHFHPCSVTRKIYIVYVGPHLPL